ncbi:hypothetical protein [Terrihabitans sp. B22-R8]|uniref:hypothetical protein n=1 Tax=Terrihabitans sp. B22-R8 TaxID=3425128 RepID=UPI00403CFB44
MSEAARFRSACHIMMNLDKHELEEAGVIKPGAVGGSDWTRFNRDPLIFVVKLPDDRFAALWRLIEASLPERLVKAI